MTRTHEKRAVYAVFFTALILNIFVWAYSQPLQAQWGNVPPVPSQATASLMTLGDNQLAYRTYGLLIQNLGDAGGNARALKEYNYERLGQWFWLQDYLDPEASFIPTLAAYYFSANQDPKAITPIIDYLAEIGVRPGVHRWRWLAQAVYLARFVQHDDVKALKLAGELADLNEPGMPSWTDQMPAFVMLQQGDKQGAYEIMVNILGSQVHHLQAAEINSIQIFICDRVLTPTDRKTNPLCKDVE